MSHVFLSREERSRTPSGWAALAEALPYGVVALDGPLGAGKTRLVQAVAAACGVDRRDVVSPTFVLMHEYHGDRPIYHIDVYRLRDDDEFLQLGVDEHFGPPNLVLIEWAGRMERCMPQRAAGHRDQRDLGPASASSTSWRMARRRRGSRVGGLLQARLRQGRIG